MMKQWEDLDYDIQSSMLANQESQGNKRDSSVFKRNILASQVEGGFDWGRTQQGQDYWNHIISGESSSPQEQELGGKSFKDIALGISEMLEIKDKAYGNAALKPLEIFARHHPYGSRLDEKLARVKNCDELRKNDVADILGGLMLICKDKEWFSFKDLID